MTRICLQDAARAIGGLERHASWYRAHVVHARQAWGGRRLRACRRRTVAGSRLDRRSGVEGRLTGMRGVRPGAVIVVLDHLLVRKRDSPISLAEMTNSEETG